MYKQKHRDPTGTHRVGKQYMFCCTLVSIEYKYKEGRQRDSRTHETKRSGHYASCASSEVREAKIFELITTLAWFSIFSYTLSFLRSCYCFLCNSSEQSNMVWCELSKKKKEQLYLAFLAGKEVGAAQSSCSDRCITKDEQNHWCRNWEKCLHIAVPVSLLLEWCRD